MAQAIVIRDSMDGTIVRSIDVDGMSDRQIEKVERGLAINFNFERYTFAQEEVA